MTQKTMLLIVGAGLVIIIALLIILLFVNPKKAPENTQIQNTTAQIINQAPVSKTENSNATQPNKNDYTMTEVAKHANMQSCWSVINNNVYDLTSWISQHAGGEKAILSICGKDGSNAFNNKHGGSSDQENILKTFKIGVLAE